MVKVTIDLRAVRHNYQILRSLCRGSVMPVVKADAYGHGMVQVSRVLAAEGADSFAIGTVEEGLELREYLPGARIYSLMGPVLPWEYRLLSGSGIIPFIHSWEQLTSLVENTPPHTVQKMGLKFDTGMNRLGFKYNDIDGLLEFFGVNPGLRLAAVSSHLAQADDPEMTDQVKSQVQSFSRICQALDDAGLRYLRSLANSAGVFLLSKTGFDLARPGIALYGGNPFTGRSCQEKGQCLKQAMNVQAPVLSVQSLQEGSGISYGLTFVAPRDMQVAIVGCGYAHGYSRSLSNRSWMQYNGHRLPVVGRVCMQLTAVDASFVPDLSAGNQVFVLGGDGTGGIDVHELAGWWNTSCYEVFCMLGKNSKTFVDF